MIFYFKPQNIYIYFYLKNLVEVLEPFKSATNTLGGDKYITTSIAHRLVKSLMNILKFREILIETDVQLV